MSVLDEAILRYHDDGQEFADAVIDANGAVVSEAKPFRKAWPQDWKIGIRTPVTSGDQTKITKLSWAHVQITDRQGRLQSQLKYLPELVRPATVAVQIESLEGPLARYLPPGGMPKRDDLVARMALVENLPVSLTKRVSEVIDELADNPFAYEETNETSFVSDASLPIPLRRESTSISHSD